MFPGETWESDFIFLWWEALKYQMCNRMLEKQRSGSDRK